MKKLIIPNVITSLNILSGSFSVFFSLQNPKKLYIAALLVFLSALFDFFDGFLARILKATSNFGKQMDSLADLVSFGIAPAFIMFVLIEQNTSISILPFLSFIIIIFSAYRLAIFNISEQKNEFTGLPTPAFAILIASIPLSNKFSYNLLKFNIDFIFSNVIVLLIITVLFSFLLIANFKLFSLKFKNFTFSYNQYRYIFLMVSALLIVLFGFTSIPLIILIYIIYSFFIFS